MIRFNKYCIFGLLLLCLVHQIEVAPTAQEDENHAAIGLLLNRCFFVTKK